MTILRLDEIGALETKIRTRTTDTVGKYLLYSPAEEPDYEDDWLLDIRLYSRSFRADRASILLQELGLDNQSLRAHIGRPPEVLRREGAVPEAQEPRRSKDDDARHST